VGGDRFIEVFVDTPVDVCEVRDVKGMYTMAKNGKIRGFTGVDDAYEPPRSPELCIDTVAISPDKCARMIMTLLMEKGFLPGNGRNAARQIMQKDAPRPVSNPQQPAQWLERP
jgi:sulfate adenylyltransferase